MPSLFGTGTPIPKGKYRELGQSASEDEFSLSDDEKVLFKKSGEIELNLCPETRIKRRKTKRSCCQYLAICAAVFVIVISLVTVVLVYVRTHSIKPSTSKVTKPMTSQDELADVNYTSTGDGWKVEFSNMVIEGGSQLLDVNGDGVDDIIIASASDDGSNMDQALKLKKYKDLHKFCESKGLEYPCMGNLMALNGHNGSQIWSLKVRSDAFVMNCQEFDINKDGKKDCIGTGRMGLITAFDPYKGEIIWTCEDDKFFEGNWNTLHAAALPDWDGDGVPEILIANGGNSSRQPKDHDRDPGRLVAVSGATGKPFGNRYLEMPNRKETYMSPVMFTPNDGGATYILFGSGGETVPGDLMGISVGDFCKYILTDNPEICNKTNAKEFSGLEKDENGIFIIYKGKEKGVMVPPVIVDHDGDGVKDILMSSFEGIVRLFYGKNLQTAWTTSFTGMESYGTPAPGHFDGDDYIDFMVTWNLGEWMSYSSSNVSVISGKDGSILWSLKTPFMQMSSDLSITTTLQHQDVFVFKVLGRNSKFKVTEDGIVRTGSRKKRHGDNPPSSHEPSVDMRKKLFHSHHLTCEDDLSSLIGEVFVIDSKTVKNPVKILEIPMQKHTYNANLKCNDIDPGVLHGHGQEGEYQEGNMTDLHDPEDSDDADANADDDHHHNRRKRDAESVKMCAVEDPNSLTLGVVGIIGDVDGDNNLDFVSVTTATTMLMDAEYCQQGRLSKVVVQKVSLEKGLLDGTFKQVPVNAETLLKDLGVNTPVQKDKTFLPMSQQKWTKYFGTKGNNVYR